MSTAEAPQLPRRIGIVVVHGVTPQPRYGMQDRFAQRLRAELNRRDGRGADDPDAWVADVRLPRPKEASLESLPFASRVHAANGDTVYDVAEAYWSPLDKHRTTARSVLSWLLRTLFVPINSTAVLRASWGKYVFDGLFVGFAVAIAVVASAVAVVSGVEGLGAVLDAAGGHPLGATLPLFVLLNPVSLAALVTWPTLALIAAGWIGAFLAFQSLKGVIRTCQQFDVLRQLPTQLATRAAIVALLASLGVGMLWWACSGSLRGGVPLGWAGLFFVLSAGSLELARAVMSSFLVDFFGDVQIYTTRDENSTYFDLRRRILDLVVRGVADTMSSRPMYSAEPYDRVYVFAHSLGSTIAMDALLQLYELNKRGVVADADWRRLRGFVTFGTALEKTKYFFDVLNPSPTAAYEQWRDDRYGVLFSSDPASLEQRGINAPIFWANYWYFQDPVANEIQSFRSFLRPGDDVEESQKLRRDLRAQATAERTEALPETEPPLVCRNERGSCAIRPPFHLVVHGDYLGDAWFWRSESRMSHIGALDILTSGATEALHGAAPPPQRRPFTMVGRWSSVVRRSLDRL